MVMEVVKIARLPILEHAMACALLRDKKVFARMVFGVCDSKLNYQGSIFD